MQLSEFATIFGFPEGQNAVAVVVSTMYVIARTPKNVLSRYGISRKDFVDWVAVNFYNLSGNRSKIIAG